MRRMALYTAFVAAGAASAACSWWRFDDIEESTPVVLLEAPRGISGGFGTVTAATSLAGRTRLLVGGSTPGSGAAVFDLSVRDNPTVDALGSDYCEAEAPCLLAARPAGLPVGHSAVESPELCFAVGLGRAANDAIGVVVRCENRVSYALEVPEALAAEVLEPGLGPVVMSSDGSDRPALLVGAPERSAAWFYASDSIVPVEVPPPDSEAQFGLSVAALRNGTEHLLAIGSQEGNRVWVYRSASGTSPELLGCIDGPPGFALVSASGRVGADAVDDLVLGGAGSNVHVFDGVALSALSDTSGGCGLDTTAAAAVLACQAGGAFGDCAAAGFGSSLSVGDLDADGDGEVVVGAPLMAVQGEAAAGAVFVYDVEDQFTGAVSDAKFVAPAESGSLLGVSVVTAKVQDRDVVVAGMPAEGAAAVLYCLRTSAGSQRGSRCE